MTRCLKDPARWPVPYVKTSVLTFVVDPTRACPFCVEPLCILGKNPQDAKGRVVRRYGCRRCAGYFTQTDEDGLVAVRDVARPEVVQAVPLRAV